MKTFKHIVGMAWSTPVVRTAVQAGLGALVAALAAAGVGVLDPAVIRGAVALAVAAAVAKVQAGLRG